MMCRSFITCHWCNSTLPDTPTRRPVVCPVDPHPLVPDTVEHHLLLHLPATAVQTMIVLQRSVQWKHKSRRPVSVPWIRQHVPTCPLHTCTCEGIIWLVSINKLAVSITMGNRANQLHSAWPSLCGYALWVWHNTIRVWYDTEYLTCSKKADMYWQPA